MNSAATKSLTRIRHTLGPSGSLRQRIIRGSFWALVGSVLTHGAAFAASVLAARFLGKTGFGELGLLRNTVGTLGIFAGLGLGLTGTKYVAELRETDPERTGRIIRLCLWMAFAAGLFMAGMLFLGAPLLAEHVIAAPHLSASLRIGALLLFVQAYDGAQKGILAGFEAYRKTAIIYAVGGVVTFLAVVLGVWLWDVSGALFGYIAGAALMLLLNSNAIQQQRIRYSIPKQNAHVWAERQILTAFSLPALLTSALGGPAIWAASALLVNQPGGYAEMGIISAAFQLNHLAMFIPRNALQVLLPVLSMELNKEGQESFNTKLMMLNSYTAFYLTTSVVILLLFFIEPLLALYGDEFRDGRIAMVLVVCSLPILAYRDGIVRFIQAKGMLWYSVAENLVWATILLVITYLALSLGANGLALAYLVAYCLSAAIFVPLYYVKLKMGRQLRRDAILVLLLSLALVPGILNNVAKGNSSFAVVMSLISLFMWGLATLVLRHWFRQKEQG